MVLAFFCKAVFTCQIAVMGDVQAECLDNSLPLFKVHDIILIYILGKEALILNQCLNLFKCFIDIRQSIFFRKLTADLVFVMVLI